MTVELCNYNLNDDLLWAEEFINLKNDKIADSLSKEDRKSLFETEEKIKIRMFIKEN